MRAGAGASCGWGWPRQCEQTAAVICESRGVHPAPPPLNNTHHFIYCPGLSQPPCLCPCRDSLPFVALFLGLCGPHKTVKGEDRPIIKMTVSNDLRASTFNRHSPENAMYGWVSKTWMPLSVNMGAQDLLWRRNPSKGSSSVHHPPSFSRVVRTWQSRSLLSSGSAADTDLESDKRAPRLRRPAYFGGGVRGPLPRPGSYRHDDMTSQGQGRRLILPDPSSFPGSAIAALVLVLVIILVVIALLLYS